MDQQSLKPIKKDKGSFEWKILVLFSLILLILNLMISTTFYTSWKYTLEVPIRSVFGNVSYGINIIVGALGTFLIIFLAKKKVAIEKIFLAIAIPIGLLYCFLNPIGKVPDEDMHIRKAMAIAQGNFFSHANEDGEASDDFDKKLDDLVNRDIYSYQDLKNRFNIEENGEKEPMGYTTMALYFPLCHIPQALGIVVARIFNQNLIVQCYLARISNFLVAISIVYFAIKYMPFKKEVLLFIALLPIVFNELASLSSDALTVSSILLFISYVLHIKYDKDKIDKKDIIVLATFSIIIALCKIVYLPICFFILVLPKEVFNSKKEKNIVLAIILAASTIFNLLWLLYSKRFLADFTGAVDTPGQIKYVLTSPIQYVLIIFRTISTYAEYYLFSLFGEGLGDYNMQASPLYVIASYSIMLFLLIANYDGKKKVDLKTRIVSFALILIVTALIFTSIYISWNPVGSIRVEGVQGRYFLPLIILIPFIIHNDKIKLSGKIDNRYLFVFSLFMNLNVLMVTLYTYIYGMLINFYIK